MKNTIKNLTFSTLVFITITAVAFAVSQIGKPQTDLYKAPAFRLKSLEGQMISLESYEGSYVVIHFATTWCPFCNAEAPYLEQLFQEYQEQNVKVLIIDVKESESIVTKYLKERFNLSFPILLDPDGSVAAKYAPPGLLPDLARDEVVLASNILIDPKGKMQFRSLLDTSNFDAKLVGLRGKLDELLAQ
ncbi:MAG: TlpA disulfide reductase family protein [Verrucomicrobia bacterium]|nr:TlpA disulfide reductase family protein [Verrucomicrobiota bacterium]MDA1069132.1 TlpA disulfide reductase family protein [Verrucomicrobiota bacterium]